MRNSIQDGKSLAVYLPCEYDRLFPPIGVQSGKLKTRELVWKGKKTVSEKAAGNSVFYEIYSRTGQWLGMASAESLWTKTRARSEITTLKWRLDN